MNDSTANGNTAEKTVHRVLRVLPERSAPASLESRVLAELQRRQASLWRRGFAYWPPAARLGFVTICGALVALTLLDVSWIAVGSHRLEAVGDRSTSWIHPAMTALALAGQFTVRLADAAPSAWLDGAVPSTWLDGILAAGVLLYAALFGLSAIAYRTLYVPSSMAGDRR